MGRSGDHPQDRALERPARRRARRRAARARGVRGRARRRAASPIPDDLHPALRAGLAKAGIDRALHPPGGRRWQAAWEAPTIVTTGTASGKSLCFNLPTLDVLCARRQGARALPLPDQGARPGPGARAPRASACTSRCAPRSTTATRRARSARRSAGGRTSSSPTPTCCTWGSCPTTRRGATSSRTSRSSSSTRRTSTAASSARTSPTCCAGCGGSPPPTARSRASCWRSATIANPVELAERLTGLEDDRARRRGRRAAARGARSRCGTRR